MQIHDNATYTINGGHRLEGTIIVQGSKNATLPMIAAALLPKKGQTVLRNVPIIRDVLIAIEIARAVGAKVDLHKDERVLVIDASNITSSTLPTELTGMIRGSILFMPPLFIRTGEVIIEDVGGCNLGARNLDFHYRGFTRLGATVTEGDNRIHIKAGKHHGGRMYLDIPSHTGTENLMMAACFANGVSVIENAAMEPEIVDFANFLNLMGAKIAGAGTGFVTVEGVDELQAVEYTIMPDRLDAGAMAMAVAATGGQATLVHANLDHFAVVRSKLEQMGVELDNHGAVTHVRRIGTLRPINVVTWPYPGFATDLQPPIMALATAADGVSYIREIIFSSRFALSGELNKFGADIKLEDTAAIVKAPTKLTGTTTYAHDIRAGIGLVIAALIAEGTTTIENGRMIERGYMQLAKRLTNVGADITQTTVQPVVEEVVVPV